MTKPLGVYSKFPGIVSKRLPLEDASLICKFCGGSYCEDEPPDEALDGFCSEECEYKDRKIDEAEARREEKEDR